MIELQLTQGSIKWRQNTNDHDKR